MDVTHRMCPSFLKGSGKGMALTQTRKCILGRKKKKKMSEILFLVLFVKPEKAKTRKLATRKSY